jgi:NADH-quinone oxidoreductase subunit J
MVLLAACALLAIGMGLLLPRGSRRFQAFGLVCTTASLGLFASRFRLLGDITSDVVFYVMAAVTLVSAVGAVTMRSPVYCAIWFALTLLGTAGLFFFQGAQFLGVATIVVYAGAILVTFLFVLMLCNPEGHSLYDRISWEAGMSAATGALLVGLLSWTTASTVFLEEPPTEKKPGPAPIVFETTTDEQAKNILRPQHVERLGAELFSKHLIAVETAGTLLLVALVGAIAIVAHGRQADATVTDQLDQRTTITEERSRA